MDVKHSETPSKGTRAEMSPRPFFAVWIRAISVLFFFFFNSRTDMLCFIWGLGDNSKAEPGFIASHAHFLPKCHFAQL